MFLRRYPCHPKEWLLGEILDQERLDAGMDRSIVKWEVAGIPFVVVLGSALHFAFAWSGYWHPLALVAAVNESVWEHLKLAFWPGFLWALIEQCVLKVDAWSFLAAKGFSLLIAPLLIIIIFYGYTSLLGRNIIALDIATFVIAITAGQLFSAQFVKADLQAISVRSIGVALLACQLAAYSAFTFYPPALRVFEDPRNGIRGIPPVNTPSPLGTHGAVIRLN